VSTKRGGSVFIGAGVEDCRRGVDIAGAFRSFFLWERFSVLVEGGGPLGSFFLWERVPVLVRFGFEAPGVERIAGVAGMEGMDWGWEEDVGREVERAERAS
jgi:hypothetical protein